jgi:ABC-type branched-subunit amino acid transport system ATPase component
MSVDTRPGLEIRDLTVRFGGLTAVEHLTVSARPRCITALIGPNGAGKSTTFNACSGTVRASSGSIRLGRARLDGKSPSARAQRGLGRTFQRVELCDAMTVADNVALGPVAQLAGRRPWGQLWASRSEKADVRERTADALARCGISDLADHPAADLSTGQRRLVELARAVASRFEFLMLDEPSSGLDEEETRRFGAVLRDLASAEGIGILLVEHDMALVRMACTYVYVMDFGQLIVEGETEEVLASAAVRAAYLGTEES